MTLKLSQLIEYEIRNIFVDHVENLHQKSVPYPSVVLVKNSKQPLHTRNLLKIRYLKSLIKKI